MAKAFLTGRTQYRIGWRQKLVMQVEYWYLPFLVGASYTKRPYRAAWQDATIEQMQQIERGEFRAERPEDESWLKVPPMPKKARPPEPPPPQTQAIVIKEN